MLSVMKQTSNPVKFWFLKNFLSPTFKVRKFTSCDPYSTCVEMSHDFFLVVASIAWC